VLRRAPTAPNLVERRLLWDAGPLVKQAKPVFEPEARPRADAPPRRAPRRRKPTPIGCPVPPSWGCAPPGRTSGGRAAEAPPPRSPARARSDP